MAIDDSFINIFEGSGPIEAAGWLSLLIVIIIGCILVKVPPRSGRRTSLVDVFAACLHVQILIFILCVPFARAAAVYATLSVEPYVFNMLFTATAVLLNFTISGALLVLVSLRHKTTPTLEWMPAVSVLIAVISLFAQLQFRMTLLALP